MEYNLRFHDSDLERDVFERLEKILAEDESLSIIPPLSSEEIHKYIRKAMEDVRNQGNMALYQGLILHVTKTALGMARKSR